MFVALGYIDMNRIRVEKNAAAKAKGYSRATCVHSRCSYLAEPPPGDNCFTTEDNTIQPFVTIGDDVTIWSGNHLGHDVSIADPVIVASHVVIAGFTKIEPYRFLGIDTTIRDHVTVREGTLVGAGAVIVRDTEARSVYLPPRATLLDTRSDEVRIS